MTSLTASLSEILQRRAELVKQIQGIDADISQLRAALVDLHPRATPPVAAVIESREDKPRDAPRKGKECLDCHQGFKPHGNRQVRCDQCRAKRTPEKAPEMTVQVPVMASLMPPTPKLPERRCGSCYHKFTPAHEREFVCPSCTLKPTQHATRVHQ